MLKNKKALVMSVLCAIASVGFVMSASAEDVAHGNLDEVVVEGSRDVLPGGLVRKTAKLGILGDKSVLDIPYSEMSMTEKAVALFDDPSQPLANILTANPSIRSSTSSPMYSDFSMRGINMNGNHMMLNGVPSLYSQFTTPPSHVIDRIDITSGPNAGVNGVSMSNNGTNSGATPAPGTINIVTKRATDTPITRYTQTYSGRGNTSEIIEVGRRFGKDNEWGLRVNAEYMDGKLSLPGAENNEKNIFINFDHRGEKSETNLFAGHYDRRINGAQRWFSLDKTYNNSVLPDAPDSKNNYDFDGTTKRMYGWIMALNHDQKMDDNWSWFANYGQSNRFGNKDNQSASIKFKNGGEFVKNVYSQMNEIAKNVYAQIGIKGKFETGEVKHNVSFAVDRSWAKYWSATASTDAGTGLSGNLNNWWFANDWNSIKKNSGAAKPSWEETNVGITVADTLEYGKASLLLAASKKHEHMEMYKNGAPNYTYTNDNILPTYGFTYKPVENLAMYVGHTESFSRGLKVLNTKDVYYTNENQIMEPVKSKQNEIGVKYQNAGVMTTLSYFDIDEANRYDIFNGGKSYTKVDDGKNRYKGVELTINGKLADKWTATGGFMYLDAQREQTNNGSKDGWFVNGVAKWSGVLGLEYKPDEDWGVVGRANWVDKAYIDSGSSSGKTEIPSYVTFDLGFNYKTKINTVPVKLSAMCYNVADKDYWMGRGSSTTFGLSMPRTFMLSAQFDI